MESRQNFFGERLKKIMFEKNISQKDLADKLGVAQQMISFWVTGKRNPTLTSLQKIASCLDVSVSDLIENKETEKISCKNGEDNDGKISDKELIMKLIEKQNKVIEEMSKRFETEMALIRKELKS